MKTVIDKFMDWLILETDVGEFHPSVLSSIRSKLEELLTDWYINLIK